MTAEQLQAARAAHWRQNRNPILTLEDAAEWLSRHPLTLFLPRRAQLPAPAPSFVEACMGGGDATPPHAAVQQATGWLARLMASDSALALNLLGLPGEQPDFIAHREVLPFLVSLRGERDWKHAPGSSAIHKISPLVVDVWKTLEQAGPLTATGIRTRLGHELTESAVLRALSELWQSLRAIPVLQPEGQPAIWELLETHHGNAVAQGIGTSQVTAISLLVSIYLHSVYAASGEEIEVFLSPLAARSRIREAVRGLSATRQIRSLSLETQTYYFLEDGLPEFAEAEAKQAAEPGLRRPPVGARQSRGADRDNSKPKPNRGDFQRRNDAKPAYGKRLGGGQTRPGQRPDRKPNPLPYQREAMAEGWNKREGSFPGQGERPVTHKKRKKHKKERWRNTPGKPGYQWDRARPQGAAPPTRRPGAEDESAKRGFSASPGMESPPRKFSDRKFQDRELKDRQRWQDRRAGTQGLAPPRRRTSAGDSPISGESGTPLRGTEQPGMVPRAGGNFPTSRSGRKRADEGARRSAPQKPGGFPRQRRPAAGRSNFSGRGPRSGKDKGRKKPEA